MLPPQNKKYNSILITRSHKAMLVIDFRSGNTIVETINISVYQLKDNSEIFTDINLPNEDDFISLITSLPDEWSVTLQISNFHSYNGDSTFTQTIRNHVRNKSSYNDIPSYRKYTKELDIFSYWHLDGVKHRSNGAAKIVDMFGCRSFEYYYKGIQIPYELIENSIIDETCITDLDIVTLTLADE